MRRASEQLPAAEAHPLALGLSPGPSRKVPS